MSLSAVVIVANEESKQSTMFKVLTSLLEYEGIKYVVEVDLPKTMKLNKGQQHPLGACAIQLLDQTFLTPYTLISYLGDKGLIRC